MQPRARANRGAHKQWCTQTGVEADHEQWLLLNRGMLVIFFSRKPQLLVTCLEIGVRLSGTWWVAIRPQHRTHAPPAGSWQSHTSHPMVWSGRHWSGVASQLGGHVSVSIQQPVECREGASQCARNAHLTSPHLRICACKPATIAITATLANERATHCRLCVNSVWLPLTGKAHHR